MKRRNFLKLLGIAVVAPGSVAAAVKVKQCKHEWRLYGPNLFDNCRCRLCGIKGDPKDAVIPWKNYYATYEPPSELV